VSLRTNNPAVGNSVVWVLIGVGIAILGVLVYMVLKGGERTSIASMRPRRVEQPEQ